MFSAIVSALERIDAALAQMATGAGPWLSLGVIALLGLRHAGDPDHIAAVSELVAEKRRSIVSAAALGAAWGAGHGLMLLMCGLVMIMTNWVMPNAVHHSLEKLIGVIILVLALRLIWRWKWPLKSSDGTSIIGPRSAFAVGGLHGLAGSGAVVLLLLAAIPDRLQATGALFVFALATALSMALCSIGIRCAIGADSFGQKYHRFGVPILGAFNLVFGVWYLR